MNLKKQKLVNDSFDNETKDSLYYYYLLGARKINQRQLLGNLYVNLAIRNIEDEGSSGLSIDYIKKGYFLNKNERIKTFYENLLFEQVSKHLSNGQKINFYL